MCLLPVLTFTLAQLFTGEAQSNIPSLPRTDRPVTVPALDSATAYSPVWVKAVVVPQYGVRGEHATLHCKYSSVQPVYSVRWLTNTCPLGQ